MTQRRRLASGGSAIDRAQPLAFTFDGQRHEGYSGDTLASALLANGVHLVGRSFKYHRPRGIYSAGVEEPNALVQLARGARTEPNTRATTLELHEGLDAASQNRWPSLGFDVGAFANLVSPLLPAGFYYKTFMWPGTPRGWMRYERAIRRAAGMGRAPQAQDPGRYEHRYAHCDVLVIGGGPAGVAAARTAAAAGARVMICQQSPRLEGEVAGPEVTVLTRTTAFGHYDGNLVGAIERVTDHLANPDPALPRQRMWFIRAGAIVLATGAIERGIAYGGNDVPGSMLAGAAAAYVERYGVLPGARAVVFANHDAAYRSALALRGAGVDIAAIVDARSEAMLQGALPARARAEGLRMLSRSAIVRTHGRLHVAGVDVATEGGGTTRLDCDLVAVSGGHGPAVHLFSHARGTLRYDERTASFVPDASPWPIACAGAVNGFCDTAAARQEGEAAGRRALALAEGAGRGPRVAAAPATVKAAETDSASRVATFPLWSVPAARAGDKCFVDLQDDVTVDDIGLAAREGYQSVEHLKRYTTLGMGTDQGKTSNVVGLALMAERLATSIPQVGTTTFRPPYTPVTLGAFPGHAHGAHVEPVRRSPLHDWHAAHGARMANTGLWQRPHSYPRAGESEDDAAAREARNVRAAVGVVDVSTLGKIELAGRDAAGFLDRVYANRFGTLAVGRCRYGLMLREDGIVRDDGTTTRLDDTHYLMTTTTANAGAIMQHLERLLQVDWPALEVHAVSVTEQWAAAALSGPRAREVLARIVDIDVSNEAFPFLAAGRAMLRTAAGEVPVRLFRMSYSGELAYEIHVPSTHALAMWEAVLAAGEPFGIMPYGTEAMGTLRIEKGHVVIGAEIDGRTTADDLGMGKLVSAAKWCIGKPLCDRAALREPGRWQLVGLTAKPGSRMPRGGKLVADPRRTAPNPIEGHVTSWCDSPHVGASIGLALLAGGRARHGETLWAVSPLANAQAEVTVGPPCFVDPDGTRLR